MIFKYTSLKISFSFLDIYLSIFGKFFHKSQKVEKMRCDHHAVNHFLDQKKMTA